MQTVQELQTVTNGNTPHLSGYDLTLLLIRGGIGRLGLNSNAKEVLLYLASCYNEKNGVVYPRVKTMAAALDISERGVIRALAELTEKGCIIRSKRKKNSNEYVITRKVLQSNPMQHQTKNAADVITHGHNDTFSSDTVSPLMNHEVEQHEVEQHQPKKADVVSLSSFSLKKIPASILAKKTDKNGRPIRNHAAYWNSLNDAQKREYLKQEEEQAAKTRKLEELKRQAQIEKQRQREEEKKLQEQLSRPLHEQWSRVQAIRHVWQTRNLHKGILKEGLTKSLVKLYNLDVTSICAMTEAEIEKFS